MRPDYGPKYRVFGLKPFALGVLVMLFAALAQANGEYIPRGQPIPQNVRVVGTNAAGIDLRASAIWMNPAGQTTHHVVPVSVPASRVGQLAKAAIRRGLPVAGWGMLLKDLINGAGWVIDELTRQVQTVGTPQQELGASGYYLTNVPSLGTVVSSTSGQLCAYASWFYSDSIGCTVAPTTSYVGRNGERRYDVQRPAGTWFIHEAYSTPSGGWGGAHNANAYVPSELVSDTDLGNLLKQHPQVINAILIDPDTGAPIRTPELIDALNALRQQLEAAYGLDPGIDLLPSEDYTDRVPHETEFPEFCMWADVVCDFIDWFKSDGEPDKPLPETELQIDPSDWQSGIGGGECPVFQPITVTGPGGYTGEVTFDWQPLCSGAAQLKPFLIAVCVMVAAFIVAGLRKSAV